MIYLVALLTSAFTGLIVAIALHLYGVHHEGIVIAAGVMVAGIQMAAVIGWYMLWSSSSAAEGESHVEPGEAL
jgi:hypothetical protein